MKPYAHKQQIGSTGFYLHIFVHICVCNNNNPIKRGHQLESWVSIGRVSGKVTKKGWREEREGKVMSFYFNQNINILDELITHCYYLLSQKWLVLGSVYVSTGRRCVLTPRENTQNILNCQSFYLFIICVSVCCMCASTYVCTCMKR